VAVGAVDEREKTMLGSKEAIATIAVRNLDAARRFYEGKLGLAPEGDQEPGTVTYKPGRTSLFVYESQFAGTNKATAVTWPVGDALGEIVRDLKAKGVSFEHYDLPDTAREGDIHVAGGVRVAWFKDPDGNIHSVVNG
jgi:catechol 2,3-dioxygenase-like lactoylglutathione lyase family enzyme